METPRLRIVPFAAEHLTERYVGWLNDPAVVRYSEQRFVTHTLASCAAYARSFDGTPHRFWAVLARNPELGHIGNLNAYVDTRHGVADVGILIGETRIWGQGYGLEAWRAVCAHLLARPDVRKVTAGTLSVNIGMRGIMRASGMIDDGRRVGQALFEGQPVDVVYAALFASRSLT
jgi:RimJ/RimL family protein N-acetyltransferase